MSKKVKKNIPKLRFPQFQDDWKGYKFSELFSISAGGDIDTNKVRAEPNEVYKYPVYANAEKDKGLYGYSNEYKIEPNVITVAGRGVNIGIAHARDHHFYPIVRLLVLKPKVVLNIYFFEYQINRINVFVESTGVPQLTAPQISSYRVFSTSIAEQEKIASFLGAVDRRLTQLCRKRELLQTYKRGVMQKLFSQQIRFKQPDGSPFPDWERKRLEELFSEFKSGCGITSDEITEHGTYPVFGGNGLRGYTEKFTHDGFYFLIGRQGALCGNIHRTYGKAYISEHAIACRANDTANTEWLAQRLDYYNLNKLSESSAQPGLSVNKLLRFKLFAPSKEEQEKMTGFLTTIDRKIETISRKIDQTEQFKKGLLQKMFV
ncbi:restriction endonuclease subunit S [Nostoc sp. CHAB 5824]|nr:restriction endonuclease subunit S [Nostoc sp. CHAB 5824]